MCGIFNPQNNTCNCFAPSQQSYYSKKQVFLGLLGCFVTTEESGLTVTHCSQLVSVTLDIKLDCLQRKTPHIMKTMALTLRVKVTVVPRFTLCIGDKNA